MDISLGEAMWKSSVKESVWEMVWQEKRGLLVGCPGDDDTSGRCADPERQGPFSGRCFRIKARDGASCRFRLLGVNPDS